MWRREGALVLALAAAAALRVFLYGAAFPFFTNIDEHRHVDAVLKYARGALPTPGGATYEPEMATFLALYASPEYHWRSDGEPPPPTWRRPPGALANALEQNERYLARRVNLEATQPPVYYALAGAWLRLGRAVGFEGGYLLYWVRSLNALAYLALVWVSWRSLRELYPGDGEGALVRLGVPILVAAFPQDSVYYVTRDALSPLLGCAGFFLCLRVARRAPPGARLCAATGAVLGLAFLAKYSNAAVLGVGALCVGVALARPESRTLRGAAPLLAMALVAAVPIALWFARNQLLFGEPLGTEFKVERMGWGRKGWGELGDSLLLTPAGLATFVTDLIPNFWRGEVAWHRRAMAWGGLDAFYTASSLLLVALAAVGLRRAERHPDARLAEAMALACVLGSVALLGGLSLLFTFTETSSPTAARPFFVEGRLIQAALVPFLLLYVRGIAIATGRLPGRAAERAGWGCVIAVAVLALASEAWLSRGVFASAYNLFHLP